MTTKKDMDLAEEAVQEEVHAADPEGIPANLWNLTDLRNMHGISTARLAAILGLTPAAVWHWEKRPASELKQKQLNMLRLVFTEAEVDSLIHPENYMDDNGFISIPSAKPEADPEEQPGEQTEEQPEEQPEEQQETQPEERQEEHPVESPAERAARLLKMSQLNDLKSVFYALSDQARADLVQYAIWQYHREHGLQLPWIGGRDGALADEKEVKEA